MILQGIYHLHQVDPKRSFFNHTTPDGKVRFNYAPEQAEMLKTLALDRRNLLRAYQASQVYMSQINDPILLRAYVEELSISAKTLQLCFTGVPLEVERFDNDIKAYDNWLHGLRTEPASFKTFSANDWTRWGHELLNFPRLLLVRTRRGLLALRALLAEGVLLQFLQDLDLYTRDIVAYQAWIFFAPRLLANLIFLCKHLFNNPWMTKIEEDFGFDTRLRIEMDKRWFELANDISWLVSGLVACFLLVGGWTFLVPYLGLFTQFLDIVIAGIRLSYEINRHHELLSAYRGMLDQPDDKNDKSAMSAYFEVLLRRLECEQNLLWLSLINATVLTMGVALFCMTSMPLLPVAAGVIVVAMTITNVVMRGYLRAPSPNVAQILNAKLPGCRAGPGSGPGFDAPFPDPSSVRSPLVGSQSTDRLTHMKGADNTVNDAYNDQPEWPDAMKRAVSTMF